MAVMTPQAFAAAYGLAPAAGAAPAAAVPGAVVYTAGLADRWDLIAWRVYGDPTQVSVLIMANPAVGIGPVLPQGTPIYCPLIAPAGPPANSTPWSP